MPESHMVRHILIRKLSKIYPRQIIKETKEVHQYFIQKWRVVKIKSVHCKVTYSGFDPRVVGVGHFPCEEPNFGFNPAKTPAV